MLSQVEMFIPLTEPSGNVHSLSDSSGNVNSIGRSGKLIQNIE
jgi:hypothetical protein